LEVFHMKSIKK